MRRISKRFFIIIFIFAFLPAPPGYSIEKVPSGPSNNKLLRVGVIPLDPFVIIQDDKPKGISIELWEEVARIHGWQYKYNFLPESGYLNIVPLLDANKLDLVIGPIAISYQRMKDITFSIPYYITTSNVITKDVQSSFSSLLTHFIKRVFRLPLVILFLTVLMCSFLIWHKERKHFPDHFPQSIYKGVPYSIWYGFHTIFAADIFFEIKDPYSRILTVIMLICSVTLISIAAASLTSALTLSHSGYASKIDELEDLKDQTVAVLGGTAVTKYVRNLDVKIVQEDSLAEAFQALNEGDVVAIIADKLLVRRYIQKNNVSKVNITNLVIRSNVLSIAMQKESELRGPINNSIVHLQDSDWIYRMCLHYLNRHDAAFCTL